MKRALLAPVLALSAMILITLALYGCNVSTANLSNIKICDKLDGNACSSDMGTIDKNAAVFHVTADLNNAPAGTKIKIDWRYLSGELGNTPQDIDSVTVTSEEDSQTLESSLERATPAWPRGDYEVVLKIDTENSEAVHKQFSVT
jgi:hypothetical protein